MRDDALVQNEAVAFERAGSRSYRQFAAALAMILALICLRAHSILAGDALEYGLTTVAFANHGTPDIRLEDLQTARPVMPGFEGQMDEMAVQMLAKGSVAAPAILRYRDGYYSIHFFGYSLLASVPFRLLQAVGRDPMRCYLIVNMAFVFALGLALYRLFGNPWRATVGLAAWVVCGGFLYWQWSSPECMSSCALLAGLIFYATGAPVAGGLLAGIAAMQNPPIVFFSAFAPLLRLVLEWLPGRGLQANLRGSLRRRDLAGLMACAAVFALPVLFNLHVFGVPSAIQSMTTDPALITPARMHAFLFDLNQGLVLGVPAVLAALLFWRGTRIAALAACVFTLAMAVPSLSTQNFNAGSAGIMRYALWASMPLLFVFLWRLRLMPKWPLPALLAVFGVQVLAMAHASQYKHIQFSPLARQVLSLAPRWYNPEPEIFAERTQGAEIALDPGKAFAWRVNGIAVKTMYNVSSANVAKQLCGPDRTIAPPHDFSDVARGWRYINGPVECMPAVGTVGQPGLLLESGWSVIEHGGGAWDGVWSDGSRARLALQIEPRYRPTSIVLHGVYAPGGRHTRVSIDGADLGWQPLDQGMPLPVPSRADGSGTIIVELQFDATTTPGPQQPDQRHLGYFLQKVTMQ